LCSTSELRGTATDSTTSPLRFRYRTIEFGDVDIHVRTLRDTQQYRELDPLEDDFGISSASWALSGVVWNSGEALARLMFDYDIAGRRILEVGCGIALASLVLQHRHEDITATDRHPEAAAFLRANEALNDSGEIAFTRADWMDEESTLGTFDLIIGADLLYAPDHADALSAFIDRHANPECEVIIIDPGRGQLGRFSKRMVSLGYVAGRCPPDELPVFDEPFRGRYAQYTR
jgi:predicted nicotinamide N-methyase